MDVGNSPAYSCARQCSTRREPQGSRKGRPRYPLEGRGCPWGRLGRGNHRRDSELGSDVPVTRPTICLVSQLVAVREVVSPPDEPAAGNLHGGVCEGGSRDGAMV